MSAPNITPPVPTSGGVPIGGSGTTGKLAKFTATSTIGDSVITESSNSIGIGCPDPANTLETYASGASGIRASSDTLANIGVFQSSSTATGASLTLRKSGGTRAIPAAVATGDTIGTVQFSAYGTSGNVVSSIASSVVAYTSPTNISSNLIFGTSPSGSAAAVTRMTLNSSGAMIMAGDGSAAAPIIANSTGVSGLYFPSSTTTAIVANGAIAATFSKVAGAGVTLGGTTGLVFDASGTQQGVKLASAPGSGDGQTLDAYSEGTWAPGLVAFTGTTPTVSANFTRVGRSVTYNVKISPTGGAAWAVTVGGGISIPYFAANQVASGVIIDNTSCAQVSTCFCNGTGFIIFAAIASAAQTVVLSITVQTV